MWSKLVRSVRRWFRSPTPPAPIVRVDWPEPTLPERAPAAAPSSSPRADGPSSLLIPRRGPQPAPQTKQPRPLILDATTVEIEGLSVQRDVVVPEASRLTRIGRCDIAGRLIVRRCARLTEIAADAATGGLVLDGATALRALPSGLRVEGDLRLTGCTRLESLGDDLEVAGSLVIRGCPRLRSLPARLRVANDLYLIGKTRLDTLPATLAVAGDIVVQHAIRAIAPGFTAPSSLAILGCRDLAQLPDGLSVGGDLILRRCPKLTALPFGLRIAGGLEARHAALTTLPDDLRVGSHVDLDGCAQLTALPDQLVLPGGMRLRRCIALTRLPAGLRVGDKQREAEHGVLNPHGTHWSRTAPPSRRTHAELDLQGCSQITALPEDLVVRGAIEIAGTGLTGLPVRMTNVTLRWNGVSVPARVAFEPETFGPRELLEYPNLEVRRVMMERLGPDRIIDLLRPTTIDEDRDPGGPRRLLSIDISSREVFVFLDCHCPSTGRRYLLRTPPHLRTCHAAAAWLAGFDDPDRYRPTVET